MYDIRKENNKSTNTVYCLPRTRTAVASFGPASSNFLISDVQDSWYVLLQQEPVPWTRRLDMEWHAHSIADLSTSSSDSDARLRVPDFVGDPSPTCWWIPE